MPQAIVIVAMAAMAAMQAKASADATNKQADAQATAAKNAAASDYLQQDEQQQQVSEQAAIDTSERSKQAMMERASLRVAQGESGLAGISQDRERTGVDMNQSYDLSIIGANRDNKTRQIQVEKNATYANAQGRVNMANSLKISDGQQGLQIGMAAGRGAMQGYSMSSGWGGSSGSDEEPYEWNGRDGGGRN